jgi:hypothetical protein
VTTRRHWQASSSSNACHTNFKHRLLHQKMTNVTVTIDITQQEGPDATGGVKHLADRRARGACMTHMNSEVDCEMRHILHSISLRSNAGALWKKKSFLSFCCNHKFQKQPLVVIIAPGSSEIRKLIIQQSDSAAHLHVLDQSESPPARKRTLLHIGLSRQAWMRLASI